MVLLSVDGVECRYGSVKIDSWAVPLSVSRDAVAGADGVSGGDSACDCASPWGRCWSTAAMTRPFAIATLDADV